MHWRFSRKYTKVSILTKALQRRSYHSYFIDKRNRGSNANISKLFLWRDREEWFYTLWVIKSLSQLHSSFTACERHGQCLNEWLWWCFCAVVSAKEMAHKTDPWVLVCTPLTGCRVTCSRSFRKFGLELRFFSWVLYVDDESPNSTSETHIALYIN